MANALQQIVKRKRKEVAEAKKRIPLEEMKVRAKEADAPRNLFKALTKPEIALGVKATAQRIRTIKTAVIAEIKRKSPSAGWIREEYRSEDFDPVIIAKAYHSAGASAISCLTDQAGFAGDINYIRRIRNQVPLPVLRKDFIVDQWQLYESRAASADGVLLIAEILTESELVDLLILATELRMTSIIEVHDVENLLKIRPYVGFPHPGYMLLGINNRDLKTMKTDIDHTLRLVDLVEDRSILISESGIRSTEDLVKLNKEDVNIVLVGEHLMRSDDPGQALRELLGS